MSRKDLHLKINIPFPAAARLHVKHFCYPGHIILTRKTTASLLR